MNTEFMIDVNGIQTKIYMQIGFFNHEDLSRPLHNHLFAEMHIFLSGMAVLECDNNDILLREGDVFFIPIHVKHKYKAFGEDARRISFLLDCQNHCKIPNKTTLPKPMLSLLCKEIREYAIAGKESKLRALLSYICADFIVPERKKTVAPITNRELIIEEFFSGKYNSNATLDDLAKELMLSPRQTEREVKRITGNTFLKELSKRKLNAAIILLQTTNLSLAEISKLVGYTSYCGLYKAYKNMYHCSPNKVQ